MLNKDPSKLQRSYSSPQSRLQRGTTSNGGIPKNPMNSNAEKFTSKFHRNSQSPNGVVPVNQPYYQYPMNQVYYEQCDQSTSLPQYAKNQPSNNFPRSVEKESLESRTKTSFNGNLEEQAEETESDSESNFLQARNSGRAETPKITLDYRNFPRLDNKASGYQNHLNPDVVENMKKGFQKRKKEEVVIPDYIRSEIDQLPGYLQSYVKGQGYMERINTREKYEKFNLYENKGIKEKDVDPKISYGGVNVYSYKVNGEERPFVEPVVVNYVNDNMPKNIKMKLSAHCIARMLERLNLNSIVDIPEWFKNHNSSVVYQDNKSSNNYLVEFTQDEDKIGFAFEINNQNAVAKTVLINKAKYGTMHNFENYDEMEYDKGQEIKGYLFNSNNF